MKKLIWILGVLACSSALAQSNGAGNGGGAYVCIDPVTHKPVSAQSLDLWENEKWTLETNLSGDEYQIAEAMIERIEKFDPVRAKEVRENLKSYLTEVHFEGSRGLEKKTDANLAFKAFEANCDLYTAAFFRLNPTEHQWKYVIDQNIWSAMNATSRAALLLHEVIYAMEAKAGAPNSDGVREQIRMIFSRDAFSWRVDRMLQFMKGVSRTFRSIQTRLGVFSPNELEFYPNTDALKKGIPIGHSIVIENVLGFPLSATCDGRTASFFDLSGKPTGCVGWNFDTPNFSVIRACSVRIVREQLFLQSCSEANEVTIKTKNINYFNVNVTLSKDTKTIEGVNTDYPEPYWYTDGSAFRAQKIWIGDRQLGFETVPVSVWFYPSGVIHSIRFVAKWAMQGGPGFLERALTRQKIVLPGGEKKNISGYSDYQVTYSENGEIIHTKVIH